MSIEVVKIEEKDTRIIVTAYATDYDAYEGDDPMDRINYLSTGIRFRATAAFGENVGSDYTKHTVCQALNRMYTLLQRTAPHLLNSFFGKILDDIEGGDFSGFISKYVEEWYNTHFQEV